MLSPNAAICNGETAMSESEPSAASRRHWLRLAGRIAHLLIRQPQQTSALVRRSYDAAASGYDAAWTEHMRDLSLGMLDRLDAGAGAECIDLTCGTGFVTAELAARTGGRVIGVDTSEGMLGVARKRNAGGCEFVQADALAYLRERPTRSADVVTCAWGLGYTRPMAVIRHAARVLRPGGRIGIIDNTLTSLAGILWAAMLTFAERPAALTHVMKVRFLPHRLALAAAMRLCSIRVVGSWSGVRTTYVSGGAEAVARLTATGAAAGFEFATTDADREAVFSRFADVLETRCGPDIRGLPITHRYLAAIGERTC